MPKMRLITDSYPTTKHKIDSVTVGTAYDVRIVGLFAEFIDDRSSLRVIDHRIFEPITEPSGDSKTVSQTQTAFSFEKFQSGAAVVTRRGDKVEHVAKFEGGNLSHPIVAYLHGRPYLYSEKGENLGSSDLDLQIVTKTKRAWINLYADSFGVASGALTYGSKNFALLHKVAFKDEKPYFTTIEVEVPE